jgi:hypothetical protein
MRSNVSNAIDRTQQMLLPITAFGFVPAAPIGIIADKR